MTTLFADSYKTYGLHPDPRGAPGDVRYVEYAPGAKRLSLMVGPPFPFPTHTVKIPKKRPRS